MQNVAQARDPFLNRRESHVMHAVELLKQGNRPTSAPVVVLFGPERFLKLEVLKQLCASSADDSDLSVSRLNGSSAQLRDVLSELSTVSMFGDRRIVLIENADDFVTENRAALEKYVTSPAKSSGLILEVKSWPKNTRLYKLVETVGLAVDCSELRGAALTKWVQTMAHDEFGKTLDRESAALIVQLAGDSLGLLQQEIAKTASLVGEAREITRDDVVRVVGGWRLETTWALLDAVRDQQPGKALAALDKLVKSGEAPLKILAGAVFSYRKLAEATELARTGTPLPDALRSAGVFGNSIGPSEQYLRRLGFEKASRILQWLVETEQDLKGGSRVEPQFLMERLFVRLSGHT